MVYFDSKFSLPHDLPYMIRQDLFHFLDKNINFSLINITSEAGYGKTTLVSSYLQEKKLTYTWFQLDREDRNPYTFLVNLNTAISKVLCNESGTSLNPSKKPDEELHTIMTLLHTVTEHLVIVLDSYQSIDGSQTETYLQKIIHHTPSTITFVITSRTRPNLNLVQLKLQNKAAEVHTNHLIFTTNEIRDFFLKLHQMTLDDKESEIIQHKTGGWAASLQLIHEDMKNLGSGSRNSFWYHFNGTTDLLDYVELEIFQSEREELKTFMLKTSILTELDSDVINHYLEIDNSEQIIRELERKHLFVVKNEHGKWTYRKLFQSLLQTKYKQIYSKITLHNAHKKLSSIYEERGEFLDAFYHSILIQDVLTSAKLMTYMRDYYWPQHFLKIFNEINQQNTPYPSAVSFSLYVLRLMPLPILNELRKPMENLMNKLSPEIHPYEIATIKYQLSGMYLYLGEIHKAKAFCEETLAISEQYEEQQIYALNLALRSLISFRIGDLNTAKQYAQQSLGYPVTETIFHPHHLANWILVEINLRENNLSKAEVLLKENLQLSNKYYDSTIIYPYCSMARLCRINNLQKEAIEWLDKAEKIAIQFQIDLDLAWVYKELILFYLETSNFVEAERYYTKAKKYHHLLNRFTFNSKHLDFIFKANELTPIDEKVTIENSRSLAANSIHIVEQSSHEDHLNIKTLGNFELTSNVNPIKIKRSSSLQLLQYFIVNRHKKINKEAILETLFPNGTLKSVNNQFYVALSELRKSLQPNLKCGNESDYIKRVGEHYFINLDRIELDIDQFITLTNRKTTNSVGEILQAEQLYQGDFFESYPYNSFLEIERERLKKIYVHDVLLHLACY